MNELALFAGAGGGILGGKLLGWRTVCAVEIDSYARRVLLARQADGCLEQFPIWDDVTTFNSNPWSGRIDVVSGGFPCQDISCAGKGKGIDGERSKLWAEMARIIGEVQPKYAFVENSPMLTIRGLGRVLGDLAALGYDARWGVLGADAIGAVHRRKRLWIFAYADKKRLETHRNNKSGPKLFKKRTPMQNNGLSPIIWIQEAASRTYRDDDVLANRVDRLKAIGNGQVPAVVALAWKILTGAIK